MADNYKPLEEPGRNFISEEELAEESRIAITNLKAETTEARVMKKTTQRSPEFHGRANCLNLTAYQMEILQTISQERIDHIRLMVDHMLIDKTKTALDIIING